MADLQPLRAVRYAEDQIPSFAAVIAPPYDVSDPVLRALLLRRTPLNIIAADLAADPDLPLDARYAHSPELLQRWFRDGVLVRDPQPALWALEQRFMGPDGRILSRRGLFGRVGVTDYGPGLIRPHERTHPAAVEDRLQLTRDTRSNLSPVFALYDDPDAAVTGLFAWIFAAAPHASAIDDGGTEHRLWRLDDPGTIAALQTALRGRELVIADGHHRYEAARRYARGGGVAAGRAHTLMLLVAQQDAGLIVQPTHRLVRGLAGDAGRHRRDALEAVLAKHFDVAEIGHAQLRPTDEPGPFTCGWLDGSSGRAYRCTLRTQATADAAMPGVPDAYRRLDTAVLQALFLTGALGLTQEDIDGLDGLGYARTDAEARELVLDGSFDGAFFLRPCPVSQVAAVAAEGLTMPAKTTSFTPKVPTGLLISPLS
ncbi:hypothetical protein DSM112329_03426 [Paraconexibacter sp. AEG42_29]|uniref:DUF1015 domain-containing protein n=1 Tax=Paraconexibacter sp. AEG42_29 TaxID=2997339 RepID=A0AAU7AY41_9ACTN